MSSAPNLPRVHCPADQANAHYNLRVVFPDYPDVLETWRAATRQTHAALKPQCDLRYGDLPLQDYDYFVSGQANAPLLVFIHGGYWQGGDKNDIGFIVEPYVKAGADAAVLNYRLAPDTRIEDMVEDVLQATQHLLAEQQAGRLTFDPQRISLMGHSAGGHLVATLACRMPGAGLPAPAHVFPISGLFDLPPLIPSDINKALGLDAARAEALSPLLMQAPATTRVQTLVGHNETAQFHEQNRVLAQVWPQVEAHHDIADTHHFTVLNALADPAQPAVQAMIKSLLNSPR